MVVSSKKSRGEAAAAPLYRDTNVPPGHSGKSVRHYRSFVSELRSSLSPVSLCYKPPSPAKRSQAYHKIAVSAPINVAYGLLQLHYLGTVIRDRLGADARIFSGKETNVFAEAIPITLVAVTVVWALLMTLWSAVLWARVSGTSQAFGDFSRQLRADFEGFKAKVPEARLQEVETAMEAFRGRIDAFVIENAQFREAVHKSMQRFDAIMRRNERALIQSAEKELAGGEGDDIPDVIPGNHEPPGHWDRRRNRPSKEELRKLLRERRGS